MKRRQDPIDPSETSGEPTIKKPKLSEDSSDSEASESSSSRKKRAPNGSTNGSGKDGTKSRGSSKEGSSLSPTTKLRSPTPKRTSSAKSGNATSPRPSTPSGRKKGGGAGAMGDVEDNLPPPLDFVPNYVDYYLLPGTTLTLHRKEFVHHELEYTAKAMSSKLSSKVSRAIKRGDYTPRSQLAPNAPLQRPTPLNTLSTKLQDPIHPIALDLKTHRKEPPPIMRL